MQVGCCLLLSKNTLVFISVFFPSPVRRLPAPISKFLSAKKVKQWASRTGFLNAHCFCNCVTFFSSAAYCSRSFFCIIPDGFIQNFLMNPVRAAITFSIPLVAPADVFHTAAAVPATDHGTEYVPTFPTGQQPGIPVLCTIVDRRTRLLFQPRLDLLPGCFSMITG